VFYGSSNGSIVLFDFTHDKAVFTLDGHNSAVTSLKLIKSFYLVSGSKDLKIWDLSQNNSLICSIIAHTASIIYLEYIQDEDILISGSFDNIIKIWNLKTCELKDSFHLHGLIINSVNLIDKMHLAVVYSDSTIKIWHLKLGKIVFDIKIPSEDKVFILTTNNNYLITSSLRGRLLLWNKTTFEVVQILEADSSTVYVDLKTFRLNDIDFLLSVDQVGVIKLWNLTSFENVSEFKADSFKLQYYYLEILSRDSFMSFSADGGLKFWNLIQFEKLTKPDKQFNILHFPQNVRASFLYFNRTKFEEKSRKLFDNNKADSKKLERDESKFPNLNILLSFNSNLNDTSDLKMNDLKRKSNFYHLIFPLNSINTNKTNND
jgi:WD40 repeat protein